jgi:hypothetical protein
LHQFELAVGMTNCTHAGDQTFTIQGMNGTNITAGSNITQGNSTLNSTAEAIEAEGDKPAGTEGEEALEFDIPDFEPGLSDAMPPPLSAKLGCSRLRVLQTAKEQLHKHVEHVTVSPYICSVGICAMLKACQKDPRYRCNAYVGDSCQHVTKTHVTDVTLINH